MNSFILTLHIFLGKSFILFKIYFKNVEMNEEEEAYNLMKMNI